MRDLTDTEKFMQIVTEQNHYEWYRTHMTGIMPHYEYDAAGTEYKVFQIRYHMPTHRHNFRLI